MDPKVQKHLDNLYRNTQQMPILNVFCLFVPVLLLISVPVGLLYAYQRRQLLKRVDSGEWPVPQTPPLPGQVSLSDKVNAVRRRNLRLWVPTILLGVFLTVFLVIVLTHSPR